MTRTEDELDEYGKHLLAKLRDAPAMDSLVAEQEKGRFLSQANQLRQSIPLISKVTNRKRWLNIFDIFHGKQGNLLNKVMAAALIVLVILAGSSISVYAAQSSLPGEPLYTVKSWSEDIRLSLTTTPQDKLDLILDYTNRRAGEINQLATSGKILTDQAYERYQGELDSVLQLAADMNDTQMQYALGQIKKQAERQGMTLEELVSTLPAQAEPAIVHLQERLREQVNLSTFGEQDPKAFRQEIRARHQGHPGISKKTPDSGESYPVATENPVMPQSDSGQDDNGNGKLKSTESPGHGNSGSERNNSSPGNGKRTPQPTP